MIDILIDSFTPCLLNRESNQFIDTNYSRLSKEDLFTVKEKSFQYDWNLEFMKNKEIYQLTLINDTIIQGLISLEKKPENTAIHINFIESASHNQGDHKKYIGVGGHLFAIAIEQSLKCGYEGFIYFEAKNTVLIKHYEEKFGARFIGVGHPYRMILDEVASKHLLKQYTMLRRG